MSDLQRRPLVSIMVPCYNSAKTLPMALASVLAQTYSTWECIVVDDGSSDDPHAVVSCIDDPRIRFHRFEKNRGRAAARQQALDMAQGDYLCMLDADDWLYTWKIQWQVDIMEANPQLGVLSTGMALVTSQQEITGVRSPGADENEISIFQPMRIPGMPPVAHAPSMLRTDVARRHHYDLAFTIAEDVDYLFRLLRDCPFGVIAAVTYGYAEALSLIHI
jgi:glycosyltransferase involved in cell wall biosynthesis